MVQPLQFQQIQQPGLGAAANILGQQTNIVNQRSKNKTDLLGRLIGAGATIGAQGLQGKQAADLQKQKQPFQLLNVADDLYRGSEQQRVLGNIPKADEMKSLADQIVGQFSGMVDGDINNLGQRQKSGLFSNMKNLLGIQKEPEIPVQTSTPPPTTPQDGGIVDQTTPQPTTSFQPINAPEPTTSPAAGDEYGANIPTPSPTTNIPLGTAQAKYIQERQGVEQKRQDIVKNKTQARLADAREKRIQSPLLLNDSANKIFSYKSPITGKTEGLPNSEALKSNIQSFSQLSSTNQDDILKSNTSGADQFLRFVELVEEAEDILRKEKRPGIKQAKDVGRFLFESNVPFTSTRLGSFLPGPAEEKTLDSIQGELQGILPLMLVVDIQGSRPSNEEREAVAMSMPSVTQEATTRAQNARRTAGILGSKIASNLLTIGATDRAKQVIEAMERITGQKYEFGKPMGITEPEKETDFIKLTRLKTGQPVTTGADADSMDVDLAPDIDFTPEDVDNMSPSEKYEKYLDLKRKGLINE